MQAGGAIGRRNYSFLQSPNGQHPVETIDWATVFEHPTKPLIADLGCGAGRYVLLMAHRKGRGKNYLGVDVHKALLDRANGWAAVRSLAGNVHYLQANAVLSAGPLLDSYPGPVELVSVQFPDPQQRRQRHIVGRELVEALAAVLKPGARVYLASDFEDTAAYMRNAFERYGSDSFRIDDAHATQPVFPCSPVTPEMAHLPSFSTGSGSLPRRPPSGHPPRAEKELPAGEEMCTSGVSGKAVTRLSSWPKTAAAAAAASSLSPAPSLVLPANDRAGGSLEDGGRTAAAERGGEAGPAVAKGGEAVNDDLLWWQGSWQRAGWLEENPVGAPTEREVYVEKAATGRVYRVLLVRT